MHDEYIFKAVLDGCHECYEYNTDNFMLTFVHYVAYFCVRCHIPIIFTGITYTNTLKYLIR
jgi:nitrate reductase cytochrome c-type subunit